MLYEPMRLARIAAQNGQAIPSRRSSQHRGPWTVTSVYTVIVISVQKVLSQLKKSRHHRSIVATQILRSDHLDRLLHFLAGTGQSTKVATLQGVYSTCLISPLPARSVSSTSPLSRTAAPARVEHQ